MRDDESPSFRRAMFDSGRWSDGRSTMRANHERGLAVVLCPECCHRVDLHQYVATDDMYVCAGPCAHAVHTDHSTAGCSGACRCEVDVLHRAGADCPCRGCWVDREQQAYLARQRL